MRVRVLSDLHLEFGTWDPGDVEDQDVVVLAGDIAPDCNGFRWARNAFPVCPIVYVMGNHEYYHGDIDHTLEYARKEARRYDVILLERESAIIDGVRFLGATLWTDFTFCEPVIPWEIAKAWAGKYMNDYRLITHNRKVMLPEHTRSLHLETRAWLAKKLQEDTGQRTVVVTHHLPHKFSVHAKYGSDISNAAYATHMPDLVAPPVDLWIHGHTHDSFEYQVGNGTKVVCNPRGYQGYSLNRAFKQNFSVGIPYEQAP